MYLAPPPPPLQVVLTALDFWQDHYVAALQGSLPGAINQAVAQHLPLLQHLSTCLRHCLHPLMAALRAKLWMTMQAR